MSTYKQNIETLEARTAQKIVSVKYVADAKIESIKASTDAKIDRLNARLEIEVTRLEAINSLDTHATLNESEAEPDMNTQTEMEA